MLDVSVVVPSHGAARTLPLLAEALQRQTLDPRRWELIVVDPHVDGSIRALEAIERDWRGPALRVIRGPLADGPGAKRNLGARAAEGTWLAFTDADCQPEPEWLERGLEAGASADIVQGATLPPESAPWHPFGHRICVTADVGLHETCNIFYRGELFERLGGFSTRYYRAYGLPFGEDAELGWRARRGGARYRFAPSAVVRHPVGPDNMRAHLREQWLGRGFPRLTRELPELRASLFWQRVFLSRRSAAFASAVAGTALARRYPAAGLLALPYARSLARCVRGDGPGARVADALRFVASDGTLAAGLWWGSAVSRSPVL